MSTRQEARELLLGFGVKPSPAQVRKLASSLTAAEEFGENHVLGLVAAYLGADSARIITEKVLDSRRITPLDGVAQRGEDVTDQRGATAPAERS